MMITVKDSHPGILHLKDRNGARPTDREVCWADNCFVPLVILWDYDVMSKIYYIEQCNKRPGKKFKCRRTSNTDL